MCFNFAVGRGIGARGGSGGQKAVLLQHHHQHNDRISVSSRLNSGNSSDVESSSREGGRRDSIRYNTRREARIPAPRETYQQNCQMDNVVSGDHPYPPPRCVDHKHIGSV